MSFTTNATVRKHLLNSQTPELQIESQPLVLTGTQGVSLPHANLVDGSVVVKWIVVGRVIAEDMIEALLDKSVALSEVNLIPGSSVVAADPGLAVLYQEEADYRVDNAAGMFMALSSGDIDGAVPLYIFYQIFDVFTEDTDFSVDYDHGQISRLGGGSIPDGATVLVDYTVTAGSVEDTLIDQAIIEAQDLILRNLAEGYDEYSDDQGITTGATQLALSIVARGLAADVLIINSAADAYHRSKEWQALSELWESTAWETLSPFLDAQAMNSPVVQ